MTRRVRGAWCAAAAVACAGMVGANVALRAQGAGTYQVVKVCALLTVAEVKKIAPWPPYLDQFAKAEEEPLGPRGSSCGYPTAQVQVLQYSAQTIAAFRKAEKVEPISGIGDEAYIRNNKDRYAELATKVGPHLLTVQLSIDPKQTFESSKPVLLALTKAFAAKLVR